ncbi:MAG TPA: TIR domain-containing protein [Pyrinomonadaceae bacterium]|jgi:superfamily II DNA or RNA helicase
MKGGITYKYDVFISYRWITPDQEWVREELYPALIEAGLKACLDVEDFIPGRDLILEMERAGSESRHVVCVISPEYFEEGRMVEFESLMARRRDPGGRHSFLIPLVLRETELPEHIRGLVPISWIHQKDHAREWRKLLIVLGAMKLETPPPGIYRLGSIGESSDLNPQAGVQSTRLSSLTQESISTSESTKFLEALMSIHQVLDMLLKLAGLKLQDEGKTINVSDAWKRLFESHTDKLAKQFENTLQKAEEVRDAIIEGKYSEEKQPGLRALSDELALASNYIDTQLRNYQREGVERAIEATLRAYNHSKDRRAGIVWQTQGSGLSLSALSYVARAISLKQLGNPTVIIVADRDILTQQLFHRLQSYSDAIASITLLVSDTTELIQVLNSTQQRIILTTLQRLLRLEPETAIRRKNILLVGFDLHMGAEKIRDVLPDATTILFTSMASRGNTKDAAVFGDLISKYDFDQAVKDKVVVPIYLERRNPVIAFTEESMAEHFHIPPLLRKFIHLHEVAQDIVSHFEAKQKLLEGKGLIVVQSQDIASTLYSEIISIRPNWHSDRDTEGTLKIVSASDRPSQESTLLRRFQSPDDPLKLVITSGIWLTGVDNPSLYIMYLLKRLSKNMLLQLMARVNRVYEGKEYGLVVDYVGIEETLQSVLKDLNEWEPE